jgi:hypothetical protein
MKCKISEGFEEEEIKPKISRKEEEQIRDERSAGKKKSKSG